MGKPDFDVISFFSSSDEKKEDFLNKRNSIEELRKLIKGDISSVEIGKDFLYLKLVDGRMFHWRMNSENDNNFTVLTHTGQYEKKLSKLVEHYISKDSVIIDIGANKGWFTVLFGKLAEDGTVYAFEPVKSAFNELKRNIHLNDLKNTQLYNMALSNYIGFGNMEIPFNHSPLAYLIEDTENCSYKTHVTTLDSFIQEMHIPKIDLIKIDAEGSEYNIILGAQKLLSSEQAPVLILEAYDKCLSRYGTNTSTLIEFLKSKNYCVFDIETMEEYNETNRISEYDTDLLCIKEKAFI